MQTATTFFDFQMKKSLSKTTTTKLYSVQECEKKHKKQCIKNIFLSDYIYSIANLWCKVCLMSMKAEQFIKSYKGK